MYQILTSFCPLTSSVHLILENIILVAERSKATVCGRSLAGISGSNPPGGMDVCVVCVLQ